MYMVSQPKALSDDQNKKLAQEEVTAYPPGYLLFLQRFGEGNYRGWMNVHLPDTEVLKPFAEYDLWEHDADSPITQEQIGQCVAIGATVDGDFLAVHPPTAQLLWLPRHEEYVRAILLQEREQNDEELFAWVLDEIYHQVYRTSQQEAVYFEPWTDSGKHVFLRLPPGQDQLSLQELAGMCRVSLPPDLSIENEYTCRMFYRHFGGYVRFNYANGQEVAIKYEQDEQQAFAAIEQWLLSKGCERYPS
ncbi:hypothetical protein BRE01_08190 [Brevibacillus reuszeri]|uniref:Knr4/Smi1-like domain-containing protein n=1 Tax=Brevibacillus reuszeri TaxID=54915 RepID=A0A0K9YS61_9BACL|nr:hypothetical protein [Brevibacillus reuszeri]KNB71472.1 hypothetical protein ADS79_22100 [Brevibacillus reuszeri]MED1855732.1 hypothetical protein [Brevibacillus reuszeri]GED67117.1 hypothetical protein BRE01_08190 [Brevibacillus reuszeri]